MSDRFWRLCKRPGLTLIEVVAAMALLSTLLVGTLVAFQKNAERIRAAVTVREVIARVDELLLGWAEQGIYPPAQSQGELPGIDGFKWETRVASRQFRHALALDIVRLQVRAEDATDAVAILSLDIPVPAGADDQAPGRMAE